MTGTPALDPTPDPATGDEATAPPEWRGLARDGVQMLVARPGRLVHRRVRDLPDVLHPGDLLVVNTSATLPAAVELDRERAGQAVHVSTQLDDGAWVVEVRRPDRTGPAHVVEGEVLRLPGGVRLRITDAHPPGQHRLWRAMPSPWRGTVDYLREHGRPIGYAYLDSPVPLADLQNVYAVRAGSAEMPSAGRPLTERVLVDLISHGVVVAPLVLHTGVSSQEAHEPPQPERFTVPDATARLVNETRRVGRRVVAVGTTVVRALETVADGTGKVHAATGWTSLVLGPARPARAVGGILTGLHDPHASHLDLIEAVAGAGLVSEAYAAATVAPEPYLRHELGDTMLFLP
jgi:S-adenosylmethionine:tRNA ribosyltransferase-isomerase